MSSAGGWIGVDLDGTLAEYSGWQGPDHIGAPVPLMADRVRRWLAEGREVRIFTARAWPGASPERAAEAATAVETIQAWCERHFGVRLAVTCTKDYGMVELYDDRAVQVEPNTGRRADGKP